MYKIFTQNFFSRRCRTHIKVMSTLVLLTASFVNSKAASLSQKNLAKNEPIIIAHSYLRYKSSKDGNTNVIVPPTIVTKITGTVRDSLTKETLPGVSVGIVGSSAGTVTDINGNFVINAPDQNSQLRFSYIGYNAKSVNIGNKTELTVLLSKSDNKLNEVVVIGYGTRAKGAVTGAISTVKSDVFENRPLNNALEALQGSLPGVTITRASGAPGNQNYQLQVRGSSSINGNSPFVLVDGIPGDINTINPNDIADVTVLKDAAAAIYGNRAADGVILVTTKKGKKGALTVNYTSNIAIKTPNYLKKMMNTLQYAHFLDEGLRNAGIKGIPDSVFTKIQNNAPPDLNQGWNYGLTSYPGFYGYTDWNKVIFKSSVQQIHNLAISGGTENTNFLLSAGYNRDNGTVRFGDNHSDKYNLRLNYDFKLSDRLNLQTRTSFDNTSTETPTQINVESPITNVVRQFPWAPVYNPQGQFYGYQGFANPAQYLAEGGQTSYNLSRFNTNFKLDYHIIDGLTLTAQTGIRLDYDNNLAVTKTFTRHNYAGGIQDIRNNPNSAAYANNRSLYKLYQLYADYNKQINTDHRISVTLGTSLEQQNAQGQNTTGYNFPGNNIYTLNLADRTNLAYSNYSGFLNNQALNSYFGRLSYSFRDKFILDLTGRTDGSSKFAPSRRWSGVFPSVALAYNVSEEQFIKSLNLFDLLKIRASYGKVGNQDISSLGLFDYSPLVTISGRYPIGSPNAGLPGATASPASTDRTWETVENKNIGVDFQMFKSRLAISFDYFNKTNEDMLVAVAVPATFGGNPPTVNQGKLVTKGFDASVNWRDKVGDFRYSIALQLSDNNSKLVSLKNSDSYGQGLNHTRQGYPLWSYFGYEFAGIIQTQAQLDAYKKLGNVPSNIGLGDVMYKDLDGDGKLTQFGDKTKGLNGDMKYLGSVVPRYTYSSNINLGYKQLDLGLFIQGVGKRMVQYEGPIATPNTFFWPSLAYYYGKTWSPTNTNAKYPRYIAGAVGYDDIRNYDYQTSTLVMQNAAYLRFKVITLGYTFNSELIKKIKLKSARIYVSGQDLFTISKGTLGGNFDPEDGYRDERTYPFNKVYSLGLDVKF